MNFNQHRQYLNDAAADLIAEGLMDFRKNAKRFRDRMDKVFLRGAINLREYDVADDWLDAVQARVDSLDTSILPVWPHLRLASEAVDLGYGMLTKEIYDDDSHVSVPEVPEGVHGECPGEGDAKEGAVPGLQDSGDEVLPADTGNAGLTEEAG